MEYSLFYLSLYRTQPGDRPFPIYLSKTPGDRATVDRIMKTITVYTKTGALEPIKEWRSYSAPTLYGCIDDLYTDLLVAMEFGVKSSTIAERTEVQVEDSPLNFRFSPDTWERIQNFKLNPALPIDDVVTKMFSRATRLDAARVCTQHSQNAFLSGMNFAITGQLSQSRRKVVDFILRNGGQYQVRVTLTTDYVVCGFSGGDTKGELIARYGIREISEEELRAMAEGKQLSA